MLSLSAQEHHTPLADVANGWRVARLLKVIDISCRVGAEAFAAFCFADDLWVDEHAKSAAALRLRARLTSGRAGTCGRNFLHRAKNKDLGRTPAETIPPALSPAVAFHVWWHRASVLPYARGMSGDRPRWASALSRAIHLRPSP